jgi:hypothetical protein
MEVLQMVINQYRGGIHVYAQLEQAAGNVSNSPSL